MSCLSQEMVCSFLVDGFLMEWSSWSVVSKNMCFMLTRLQREVRDSECALRSTEAQGRIYNQVDAFGHGVALGSYLAV